MPLWSRDELYVLGLCCADLDNVFQAVGCFSPGGSVYTRWGRRNCPRTARLIYSGFVGGSHYSHHGAAVEPLCLPVHPQWRRHNGRTDAPRGFIYGAEYEVHRDVIFSHLHDHDVPCAVCETRRRKSVMVIPARTSCYRGWRKEYSGYLMTGRYTHPAASTYSCVDQHAQPAIGGHQNHNGYLFYLVEARCGSLKCPPYHNGWEITCVVCSKA
ncbi:short-chain collagen C4-like [Saccostrea echinata]|uniref:short-chain collagen C4-like n=1 Tax=Saccostrea echinata TaxID=191078 RepID=UPI002A80981A|nr:short-chain collagen C4-like [Saccostrea echinata]